MRGDFHGFHGQAGDVFANPLKPNLTLLSSLELGPFLQSEHDVPPSSDSVLIGFSEDLVQQHSLT